MQRAQPPRREILEPARERLERAVGEPHGDRVDAEVAPREVLGDRGAELDLGQRTRPLVALAARRGEVDLAGRRGGAEALVHERLARPAAARRPRRRPPPRDRGRAARARAACRAPRRRPPRRPGRPPGRRTAAPRRAMPRSRSSRSSVMSQLPSQPMSSPDSPRSRRRIVIWVGLAAVAAAGRRRRRLRPALRRRRVQPGRRVPRRADRDPRPRARQAGARRLHLAAVRLLAHPPPLPRRPRSRCARRSSAAGRGTRTRCSSSRP